MRDRLIELIQSAQNKYLNLLEFESKILADHLLTNGVIVPPCKVGDTVWIIEPRFYNYEYHTGIQRGVCQKIELSERWGGVALVALDEGEPHTLYYYNLQNIGKTVFLTKEAAEQALKGGDGE
jgi:hypothetical protein